MTVYVFAPAKEVADRWVREQGIDPRDALFCSGHQAPWGGIRFRDVDRVVILEPITRALDLVVRRLHHNSVVNRRPPIERYNLTVVTTSPGSSTDRAPGS